MSNWIKFDQTDLGWPVVNFVMTSRCAVQLRYNRGLVIDTEHPIATERSILLLVAETFPEYADGILLAIGPLHMTMMLSFTYAHRDLPREKGWAIKPPSWELMYRCACCCGPIDYDDVARKMHSISTPCNPTYTHAEIMTCSKPECAAWEVGDKVLIGGKICTPAPLPLTSLAVEDPVFTFFKGKN